MKKRFIFYLLGTSSMLFGEECISRDSPHTIEIIDQGERCSKNWEIFEDEIAWFLVYNNPYKNVSLSEEDSYLKDKWDQKQEEFAQSLTEAGEAFCEFRQKVGEAIIAKFGEGRYAYSAASQAESSLTSWYIEFMENNLFPHDWKELYDNHKKKLGPRKI